MIVVGGTGKVISNFALTHFNAAKHFSIKTREIEKAGQPYGNYWEEISIYCASCVMTAAASIEALINELFIEPGMLHDTVTDFDTFFWGREVTNKKCLFFREKKKIRGLEMEPVLDKYRKAVKLLGKHPLSRTDPPYRTADTLIGFRNYLIHFKPLWNEGRKDEELEQRINGLFELSPYVDEGASLLEMKCMSAGCSAWAVKSVVDFVEYFRVRSGIDTKKLKSFK